MLQQANKKRRDVQFAVGDEVMLSTKNLRILGDAGGPLARRKLLPRFIGPFTVQARINSVAYRIHLPEQLKCHPTFHVSLLRPYYRWAADEAPPLPEIFAGLAEWEVQAVVGHRTRKEASRTVQEYKVRWLGYPAAYDTWEPESHLRRAAQLLLDYMRERGLT